MLRGIQAAATGMDAATEAHTIISQNLAHVSVPGYRRVLIPFATLDMPNPAALSAEDEIETVGTQPGKLATDFTPGVHSQTGNPLDVALGGDGFFVVEGPNGPLYTRSGAFRLNAEQQLVTADGLPVMGQSGPIQIPAGASVQQIQISPDGTIRSGREEIGRLNVMKFADPQLLQSVGASLFYAPPQAQPTASDAIVIQGSRELSNVSAVSELVNLITAQRHYEASQRTISALDRAMQRRLEST
jgi:flagellar basal body rod protein FlgG